MFLPWAPKARMQLSQFFLNRSDLLLPLGAILLGIAILLFAGFLMLHRRRFTQLTMEAYSIDSKLLRDLLEDYWKKRFPIEEYAVDIMLHPGPRIECIVELPPLDPEAQEVIFSEIEQELGILFASQLGYRDKFLVTAIEK